MFFELVLHLKLFNFQWKEFRFHSQVVEKVQVCVRVCVCVCMCVCECVCCFLGSSTFSLDSNLMTSTVVNNKKDARFVFLLLFAPSPRLIMITVNE